MNLATNLHTDDKTMKELTLIEKAFYLKKNVLFKELDLDLLLIIAEKMVQDVYDKKEKIFDEKQAANRMYFIYEGKVKIYKSNKSIYLDANDFFAEESLFNDKPRDYSAICIEDTVFLTLSKTNVMTIISECPSIAISLLEIYTTLFPFRHQK